MFPMSLVCISYSIISFQRSLWTAFSPSIHSRIYWYFQPHSLFMYPLHFYDSHFPWASARGYRETNDSLCDKIKIIITFQRATFYSFKETKIVHKFKLVKYFAFPLLIVKSFLHVVLRLLIVYFSPPFKFMAMPNYDWTSIK